MQHYYKPKVVVLKGEDAIEVLEEYITELEYNKPEELSQKQAQVMIKLAKGLISTIEEEPIHRKNLGESRFLPKLEAALKKCISKIEPPEEPINTRHTDAPNLVYYYPQPVNREM